MAEMTTKQRKKLPKKEFALPAKRKYPINDKSHAANAKSRAQQQYDKGNLSKAELAKIDRAANKVLKKDDKKKDMLVKGKKAETPAGMRHNVKVMEKAGYPRKRAVGAAYGEVGMAKKARRDESSGMKKAMAKKRVMKKKA